MDGEINCAQKNPDAYKFSEKFDVTHDGSPRSMLTLDSLTWINKSITNYRLDKYSDNFMNRFDLISLKLNGFIRGELTQNNFSFIKFLKGFNNGCVCF